MKSLNRFLISFFFISFSFCEEPLGGVLAVVGEEIITQGEFFQQLSAIAEQRGVNPSITPKKYEKLADNILSNMIDQYVLLDHAIKDSTIIVSDEEVKQQVEQQISFFIDRVGSVEELESIFNMSLIKIKEYYWEEVYHSMLIDRFKYSLLSDVSVGKKEVEDFYSSYKDSLPLAPETVDVSLLNMFFEPSEETLDSVYSVCLSIKDSIDKKDKDFNSFVSSHSDDISSLSDFGVVGYTNRGTLFPEYEEASFSALVGEVVGPIKTSAGFHIIKILDKRGESINTQHLLKVVLPTDNDKKLVAEKINSIYKKSTEDDLFLESYIDGLDKRENSFTRNSVATPLFEFPDEISSILRSESAPFLFPPTVLSNGSLLLVYLYNRSEASVLSLENSFENIESLAKEKKASDYLDAWLIRSKKNVFINIFE